MKVNPSLVQAVQRVYADSMASFGMPPENRPPAKQILDRLTETYSDLLDALLEQDIDDSLDYDLFMAEFNPVDDGSIIVEFDGRSVLKIEPDGAVIDYREGVQP